MLRTSDDQTEAMTRLSRCALRVGALVLCIFFFNLSALRFKLLQARFAPHNAHGIVATLG